MERREGDRYRDDNVVKIHSKVIRAKGRRGIKVFLRYGYTKGMQKLFTYLYGDFPRPFSKN